MKVKLICMAVDALFIALTVSMGYTFRRSGGLASRLLPGFKNKTSEERAQYDEEGMCQHVGFTLLTWAGFFILGVLLDAFLHAGVGLAVGVVLTLISFLMLRRKMSDDFAYWRKKS